MATNNEILMKHKSIADDYSYKYKREDIFDMLKEARADTAKQIFAKLDKIVWQHQDSRTIMEFYEQFVKAKDIDSALKVATTFSIIGMDAEKYEAFKKEYKVD